MSFSALEMAPPVHVRYTACGAIRFSARSKEAKKAASAIIAKSKSPLYLKEIFFILIMSKLNVQNE